MMLPNEVRLGQPCLLPLDELADDFWPELETKLPKLRAIIADHFGSACATFDLIGEGAYARVYGVTLQSGVRLAARIGLPVRPGVKTEAEVATMEFVRARTSVPVPKVHLFSSTNNNPVGAEWIVMDYMPGKRFMDCFEDLTYEQKQRTASDMVEVIHALYSITATHCGSLQDDLSPRSSKRATRYGGFPSPPPTIASVTSTGQFVVGPAIELSFMEFPDARTAPTEQYGPYASERQYLEGLAFIGFSRTPAVLSKLMRWPFEKALEIYDRIQPAYSRESAHISADPCDSLFHFCHGDLSISNILLDPATGGITAILDWEVAGFRPAWAAAQAGGWFCDDAQRFVMSDNQDAPEGYDEETEEDHELRSYFRGMVEQRSAALLYHLDRGVELRAIRYILSEESGMDVVGWMEKYEKYEWDVALRGPFPFDREAWTLEWVRLYNRLHAAGEI